MKQKRSIFWNAVIFAGVLCGGFACTEVVTVGDLPATAAFVGPNLVNEDGNIETYFGVDDEEGGTVSVAFSVCADSGVCLEDVAPLAGSVTLEYVPVPAKGARTPQRVVWAPPCESHADTALQAVVAVEGSDLPPLASAPFVLRDLGACP